MAKVTEYIDDWKASVVLGVPLGYGQWPESRSDQWRPIFRALCDANASRDLADRVRDRLADNPPKNFAAAIEDVKAAIQAEQRSGTVVGDREQALAASMSCSRDRKTGEPCPCDHCHGMGITYFVRTDGEAFQVKTPGGLRRSVHELPMLCACPYGRWLAAQPKCPHPDSVKYGMRVMTAFLWETRDVIDRDEETDAQRARRMINETWAA